MLRKYRCQCHVACQPPWEIFTNFSPSPRDLLSASVFAGGLPEDDDFRGVVVVVLRNNYSF